MFVKVTRMRELILTMGFVRHQGVNSRGRWRAADFCAGFLREAEPCHWTRR